MAETFSPRIGLRKYGAGSDTFSRAEWNETMDTLDAKVTPTDIGDLADLPLAGVAHNGHMYFARDVGRLFKCLVAELPDGLDPVGPGVAGDTYATWFEIAPVCAAKGGMAELSDPGGLTGSPTGFNPAAGVTETFPMYLQYANPYGVPWPEQPDPATGGTVAGAIRMPLAGSWLMSFSFRPISGSAADVGEGTTWVERYHAGAWGSGYRESFVRPQTSDVVSGDFVSQTFIADVVSPLDYLRLRINFPDPAQMVDTAWSLFYLAAPMTFIGDVVYP